MGCWRRRRRRGGSAGRSREDLWVVERSVHAVTSSRWWRLLGGGTLGGERGGAGLEDAADLRTALRARGPWSEATRRSGSLTSVGGPAVMKVPAPWRVCTTPIAASERRPARTLVRLTPLACASSRSDATRSPAAGRASRSADDVPRRPARGLDLSAACAGVPCYWTLHSRQLKQRRSRLSSRLNQSVGPVCDPGTFQSAWIQGQCRYR